MIDQTLYTFIYVMWLIILFPQKVLDYYDSFLAMLHEGQIIELPFHVILFPIWAFWLYHTLFECSSMQATLGKGLLSMKVTDMKGDRIGFFKAAARSLFKFIVAPFSFIAFFTKRKRTLHDVLAGTMVVKTSFVKVENKKNVEHELMKMLEEGKIKTYKDFMKRRQELLGSTSKKAM